MRAKVRVAFIGKPDGAVYGRPIPAGEVIEGDLAEVAVRDGFAVMVEAAESIQPAPEPAGEADLATDAEPPKRRKG